MERDGGNWDTETVKEKPQKGHITKIYRKGHCNKKDVAQFSLAQDRTTTSK